MRRHRNGESRRAQSAAGSPSPAARTRLAASVQREISDLRARVLEASLRAQVLIEAGLPSQAAEVMDEQRELVERFRERVQGAVASALVEREAELVLASAPDAGLLDPQPDGQGAPGTVQRLGVRLSQAMERLPATASAALAAIVALGAVVLADVPEPRFEGVADMYRARPVVAAPERPQPPSPEPEPVEPLRHAAPAQPVSPQAPEPSRQVDEPPPPGAAADETPGVTPTPSPTTLNDGVRWLLDRPGWLMARIADSTSAAVRELLELDEVLSDVGPPQSGTGVEGDADRDASADEPSPLPLLDDLLPDEAGLLDGLDDAGATGSS